MTATASWAEVQSRAASPGSPILSAWRAEREASRALRNDVTDSTITVSTGDRRIVDFLGSAPSAAGMRVSAESAMRVSTVFACVQKIAGAISSMPIHVYKRTGQDRERIDSPLWWLLNEQPTARYTAASMWEHTTSSFLLRESGFVFIKRGRLGDVKELIPLPWSAVTPRRRTTDIDDRLVYDVSDVRTWGVDQDDMLHFPGFGFDGLRGMSVIQWAARNATGNAMAMDEYSGRFFAGGSHPSMVLETEKKMNPDQIASLQEAYSNKYSGIDNAHRLPLILTEGLQAKPISLTAEDAQLLDARKFQVIDIARAFGVPPHMIGETSASTSWGSGIEAMSRAFVTYTLNQHLRRIEQELNRKLFRTAGNFLEFNRDALLEGDSAGQAKYFRAAVGGPGQGPGWMSVDEIRKVKNLKAEGGKAAAIYFPPDQARSTPKDDDDEETSPAAA